MSCPTSADGNVYAIQLGRLAGTRFGGPTRAPRSWIVDNLYAADGAVFPTASGCNPTLTICAVALRTAHGIAVTSPRADSSGAEAS